MTLTEFLLARIADDDYSARDCTGWASFRVLTDCEAKRRIVRGAEGVLASRTTASDWIKGYQQAMIDDCKVLALPYSDHPDYREEWKP